MTWRPWIIVGFGVVALLVNGMLLIQEKIIQPDQAPDVRKIEEKLKTLQYLASNRRANFQTMGMDFDMAEATATAISRFQSQAPKFEKILDDQAAELVDVFCPTVGVPQPYGALAYLVTESNSIRYVVDPRTLSRFERQPWYNQSLVPALYDHFERSDRRKAEATLMAVSSVLLNREADALDGRNPWSLGVLGSWGFGRLERQDPRVRTLAIEYFSVMHFLTELANTKKGICT